MSEIKLNKATFKGKTRYFESISKSMKESSDMWQYELNGDELVTLKDGREGTLGGLIYDEDNTFIGYEFSENPYGGYNYEEIKPEDIEKVSDIYADEDLMEALNEISREKANKVVKRRADQQYDAIQNYDINKPDTVDALHKAEDKLDRALNLRRNSAKLRKDESKINETIQDKDKAEIEKQVRRVLGSEVRRVDFKPNTIEVCVRDSHGSKLNDDDVWNDLYHKVKPLGVNDIEWFQESVQKSKSMSNKYGEEVDTKEWETKEARGLNETKSNEVKIFLTNLGKYNEGELVGEWVELPVDDWQPIFDRIGINDEYEEWFITDYEAPFKINEYDDIEELNEIAEKMQGFTDIQVEVLETCIDDAGYEMRDAIEKVADYDFFYVAGDTQEDLAYNYIAEIGSLEDAVNKDTIARYFDYEAFGRDLVLGGDFYRVDDVVNLDSLSDRDTAENIFGSEGEELPSDENIETFKRWIEIYNNYDESQEEQLAEQKIEVFGTSIIVDEVWYDVDTLEEIVDKDYELQSGFSNGDYVVDVLDETELAEYVVDNIYGDINELGDETLATYFDYDSYGRDLAYDFYKTENGWVDIN